jgi:GT2 family glycosyltransferase
MKKKTLVTIVIPGFRDKEKIFRLLDSIKKTKYKLLEVVVSDNSPSEDDVLNPGRKKYKWVKWVDCGRENIGQAQAYNIGFANAKKGSHILYCDSDVVLDPACVGYLVERIESDKKIGIVTPMILYLEDKNWVNQAGSTVDLKIGKVTVGWGAKKDWERAMRVQGSGTVMLFKNEVIEKIGGLVDWFMCYFDTEYSLRALKAGYETWYEPKAKCYHDQPKDSSKWRPRVMSRAYLLGRNRTLFMRRYVNMLIYTLFLPILLAYYFVEALRFGIMTKWFELIRGTAVGYFIKDEFKLKEKLPKIM